MCNLCPQDQSCLCQECVKNTLEQLLERVDRAVQQLENELVGETKSAKEPIHVTSSTGVSMKLVLAIVIIVAGIGAVTFFILFGGVGGSGGGGSSSGGSISEPECGRNEIREGNKCVPIKKVGEDKITTSPAITHLPGK